MKKLLAIAIVVFIFIGLYSVTSDALNIKCQYPARTTNPPGGCDNSDPCDPMDAVKGGSGECKDVEQTNNDNQAPSSTPPAVNDPQPKGEYFSGK